MPAVAQQGLLPVDRVKPMTPQAQRAGGLVLSASLRGLYVFRGFGISRSLQIFCASMSLTSVCLGTDERLFFVGLPHHE